MTQDELIAYIQKEVGAVLKRGNDPSLKVVPISTGIHSFDSIIGGGVPRGRYTIFTGSDSSGKSTLSALCAKSIQEQNGIAAYIDAENSYDPKWWELLKVNTNDLIYVQTNIGEKLLDTMKELAKAGIDLIILDSIASLVPGEEYEKNASEKSLSVLARLVNSNLKKIIQYNEKSAIILINQFRSGIGGYLPIRVLPGGLAQRFDASLICNISRGDPIINKEKKGLRSKKERQSESDGYYMKIYIDKSKICKPFGSCIVPVYFDGYIDDIYSLFEKALETGIIERNGHTYTIGTHKHLGKEGFLDALRENKELQILVQERLLSNVITV